MTDTTSILPKMDACASLTIHNKKKKHTFVYFVQATGQHEFIMLKK